MPDPDFGFFSGGPTQLPRSFSASQGENPRAGVHFITASLSPEQDGQAEPELTLWKVKGQGTSIVFVVFPHLGIKRTFSGLIHTSVVIRRYICIKNAMYFVHLKLGK